MFQIIRPQGPWTLTLSSVHLDIQIHSQTSPIRDISPATRAQGPPCDHSHASRACFRALLLASVSGRSGRSHMVLPEAQSRVSSPSQISSLSAFMRRCGTVSDMRVQRRNSRAAQHDPPLPKRHRAIPRSGRASGSISTFLHSIIVDAMPRSSCICLAV